MLTSPEIHDDIPDKVSPNKHHQFSIQLAPKSAKKSIQRFYKQQNYSASFIGYDNCYLVSNNDQIIACVIISRSTAENHQWLLHGLVVDKAYQNLGLGRAMLSYVTQQHYPLVCFAKKKLSLFYLRSAFEIFEYQNDSIIDHENNEALIRIVSPCNLKRYLSYRQYQADLAIFYYR